MRHHFAAACRILDGVFAGGAYVDRAFDGENASDMTAKLVYGVLEQNVRIEYILSSFLDKKPQRTVYNVLKVGVYALLYLDNVPDFAVVSECVECVKILGKGALAGLVNAVLKKVAKGEFSLPKEGEADYISVKYSLPAWFVDAVEKEYGKKAAEEIFAAPACEEVHARVNARLSSPDEVKRIFDAQKVPYRLSSAGGFLVRPTNIVKSLFAQGVITFQSPSSVLAVRALAPRDGSAVLDLCSAPGGKAVLIAESCPSSEITACDIHPHRLALIEKYAARMHATNVKPVLSDATVFNFDFAEKFDFVLVDAPCSCFGTYKKHPDVFLQHGLQESARLAATQKKILTNAAKYLKKGGVLVYSTCTIFNRENGANADFAQSKLGLIPDNLPESAGEGTRITVLPHEEWDGFFIARFVK